MRIVLVNWARIWEGAAQGGGVNQYVQALGIELVKRGHEVISLCGGTVHVPHVRGPLIRRHHDWLGVRVYEVVNSPVLAPSLAQFERPLEELESAPLDRIVGDLFDHLRPQVVHWNNLEGFSAACVAAARLAGARNIFSLHNYHTICPQVYLMQGHRVPCQTYDNGHACASCVKVVPVEEERRRYEAKYLAQGSPSEASVASGASESERHRAITELKDSVRWMPRSARAAARLVRLTVAGAGDGSSRAGRPGVPGDPADVGSAEVPNSPHVGLPGREVRFDAAEAQAYPVPGPIDELKSPSGTVVRARLDQRGMTPHLLAELNPPVTRAGHGTGAEFRALTNDILPEPVSSHSPNAYAERRGGMVRMLNSCDRVLAVSSFVRDKFISMGVEERVIRTQAIGSRINRVVALKPDLAFAPPAFLRPPIPNGVENRPVRLHFMGFNNFYKGLSFFASTLEELEPDVLRRLHLSIYALDGHSIEWMFRRMEPRLAGLRYGYQYSYHDIPWMLGGRDLTIVPSVWWDNGPQTVFESLACGVPVLGAAVGGIPDHVSDGVNGLLFRGNDRADLAATLRRIVEEPWIIDDLRKNVRPPKSIESHAEEIERVYTGQD